MKRLGKAGSYSWRSRYQTSSPLWESWTERRRAAAEHKRLLLEVNKARDECAAAKEESEGLRTALEAEVGWTDPEAAPDWKPPPPP